MRVLVSDTSVLIDLERGELLEPTFRLAWEFAVPDLLYMRKLRDFNGSMPRRMGLRAESLDGEGVRAAVEYRRRVPALSLADCFALALAKINNWMLLAGDGALRSFAAAEGVDYHDARWVIGQLLRNGVAAAETLHRALTTIAGHSRCRLPLRCPRAFRSPTVS